jgi:hypothetical protein
MSTIQMMNGAAPFDKLTNGGMDEAVARLTAVSRIKMVQQNAVLEAVTGGVMPNTYLYCDFARMYQPMRSESGNGDDMQPWGEPEPWPMFFVEEQMGGCCSQDCLCRCCCSPGHPVVAKFYVATDPHDPGSLRCCGCTCGHRKDTTEPDKNFGAFMTAERLGCCQRFANCWVCCECCQDEMRLHKGDVGLSTTTGEGDMAGEIPTTALISRGLVPIGGGGCTPTVELWKRTAPGEVTSDPENDPNEAKMGVTEGPMCFGGCKDFLCDTEFWISTEAGKHDVATITKKKPETCSDWCVSCCTPADTYFLQLTESGAAWAPEDKAMMLAQMVHLDYMFFENDRFPVTCEMQGDTFWMYILCCLSYCYGCLIPIQCCCCIPPAKQEGGAGDV